MRELICPSEQRSKRPAQRVQMKRRINLLGCCWCSCCCCCWGWRRVEGDGESIRIRGDGASLSARVGVLRSLLRAPLPPLTTLLPLFLVNGDCSILCFHSSSRFIDSSLWKKNENKNSGNDEKVSKKFNWIGIYLFDSFVIHFERMISQRWIEQIRLLFGHFG